MIIVGISLTHDGTLTVLEDGVNVFSIGEERLNRTKSYIGFPFRALRYVIEKKIIEPHSIDMVSISSGTFKTEWARSYAFELTEDKKYYDIQNDKAPADFFMNDSEWQNISSDEECRVYVEKKIREILEKSHITAPIVFFDHHLAHAASAYYAGGKAEALILTLDGEGDLVSGTASTGKHGVIEVIHRMPVVSSIGYLYSEVTRKCGFKMSRHEGKITGLAAYGDYRKSKEYFDRAVSVKAGSIVFNNKGDGHSPNLWYRVRTKLGMRPYANNFWRAIIEDAGPLSKEDLSAAVQHVLEEKVAQFAQYWVTKTGIRDVVVAGGVFANVKLNQRIAELECVDSFFVFPDMGDGGNAYGAAILAHNKDTPPETPSVRIRDAYLGPSFTNDEVEAELGKHSDIIFVKTDDASREAAQLVADKKIIGWFQGRMEYGPRALGNRSVIAHPTDASINKWLNDRMKRTEFMPFAPSCLIESADDIFDIEKPSMKSPAEFMTITFMMKEAWRAKASAVAHVDGTARPQLVRKDTNPRFHALITHYKDLTGLPLVINTSFNVHEEPIVCSPADAISSLKNGMIDVLVIEDFIARKKTSPA